MSYTALTLKKLFSLAGNTCAFPGCNMPVFDTAHGVLTGQICHIKGKSKNGPRYDPNQTDEERNGYENLLVMCAAHNKIVDDEGTRDQFPVELLREFKRIHETRSRNSTVKDDLVEQIVARLQPTKPQIQLTPIVEGHRTSADNQMGIDYYDFQISLRNDSSITVREYSVIVEVPGAYADTRSTNVLEVWALRTPAQCVYRKNVDAQDKQMFSDPTLFPDYPHLVMQLGFSVTFEQYKDVTESILIKAYAGNSFAGEVAFPIADMLNKERVEQLKKS